MKFLLINLIVSIEEWVVMILPFQRKIKPILNSDGDFLEGSG
jgi:hypothetical protein